MPPKTSNYVDLFRPHSSANAAFECALATEGGELKKVLSRFNYLGPR